MTINALELLRQGLYCIEATQDRRLFELAKRMSPVRTKFPLIRVGGDGDGGYLIPDDLDGISALFSPGVGTGAGFEEDCYSRFGIHAHLADFSVDGPPIGFKAKSFTKKFISACTLGDKISLEDWISGSGELSLPGDFILQMDIEGSEYSSIISLPVASLLRFRIIVVEVHNLFAWACPVLFGIVEEFFDKLLSNHYVVHIHPNNNDGLVEIRGFKTPRTIEVTFLRRDRADVVGMSTLYPHPLDRPNSPVVADFPLPDAFYRQSE